MKTSLALAGLIVLLSSLPVRAEEPGFPPVPGTRSLFLLDLPFHHLAPLNAPSRPGFSISARSTHANTFSHTWHPRAIHEEFSRLGQAFIREEAEELHLRHPEDNMGFIDGEVTRFALELKWAFSRHWWVAAEVPYISFSAISSDSFVEKFHELLSIADAQRLAFPRSQLAVMLQNSQGALQYTSGSPGDGLGDAVLSGGFTKDLSHRASLSVGVSLKLPTGEAGTLKGSGSLDAGLQAALSYQFGGCDQFMARLEPGVVFPGSFQGNHLLAFDSAPFGRILAALQARVLGQTILSFGIVFEGSPLRKEDAGDRSRASLDVLLGLTQTLSQHVSLEFSMVENYPPLGDSIDFAAGLALRYQY